MRALIALAAVLPLLAAAVPADDRSADIAYITQGEQDWGHAFVVGDVGAIDRLLARDFIGIDTHGKRYDKAQMVAWVQAGPNLTSDVIGPVDIVFYGDTAVVRGTEHQVGAVPARRPADRAWTDVWVRRAGQWQIVAATDVDPDLR